jgi:hypothetical protein
MEEEMGLRGRPSLRRRLARGGEGMGWGKDVSLRRRWAGEEMGPGRGCELGRNNELKQ